MVLYNGSPFPSKVNPLSVPVHRPLSLEATLRYHNLRSNQGQRARACVSNRTVVIPVFIRTFECHSRIVHPTSTLLNMIPHILHQINHLFWHVRNEKLKKKSTRSSCLFAHPSVVTQIFENHLTDYHEILCLEVILNMSDCSSVG
jgi:hypothetical protein